MKLLLHICCAPCSIHPRTRLKNENLGDIVGFFYNPNIHPYAEYIKRKDALQDYSKKTGFEVIFHKYDVENFFRSVSGNEEIGARCRICWRMRLEEAARFARLNDFSAFTTTLLASPYQDHGQLRQIGKDVSRRTGVDFMYEDFRDGFRAAQEEAKNTELYRQKYCGCIFSERERYERRK